MLRSPERIEMETLHEPHAPSTVSLLRSKHKDYFVGIGLLFAVVLLWTISNFVTQVSCFQEHQAHYIDCVPLGLVRGWIR
jgi:hypothetical protein